MSDNIQIEIELFRHHRDGQTKMVYTLLTVTTTAIGFSVLQTKDSWLGKDHIPLGLAVFFWGVSIICGWRHLNAVNRAIFADLKLVRLRAKSPVTTQVKEDIVTWEKQVLRMRRRSKFNFIAEFWLFFIGVLAFLVWHILEMYLRSVNPIYGN